MNLHAPEWSGEVRSITYSADGKSVSVVYRVTLYGTDAEGLLQLVSQGTGILCRRQKRWHFVELVLALGLDCIFIMKTWNSAVVSWPWGNYAWDDVFGQLGFLIPSVNRVRVIGPDEVCNEFALV
ncbi:UNVERIFIED_CONTAM: DNA repair -like protein 1, mitochondrial [Sesamum radiatum]|uniref:DNA repair -like protein 1, mitochondrial n=1 Tax=Sesamum radiatum TaxID=300843 RepID=A0AAW2M7E0_SESRA